MPTFHNEFARIKLLRLSSTHFCFLCLCVAYYDQDIVKVASCSTDWDLLRVITECHLKVCLFIQGLSATGCSWVHALPAGPPPQGAAAQSQRGISPSLSSGWGQTLHHRGQMLHVSPSNSAIILFLSVCVCVFMFQVDFMLTKETHLALLTCCQPSMMGLMKDFLRFLVLVALFYWLDSIVSLNESYLFLSWWSHPAMSYVLLEYNYLRH